MLARQVDDAAQQLIRVHDTRWVIGVDDDDAFGAWRDLGADVGQVGHPASRFVAQVMHRRAAREAGRRGPQRVVWHGQQQLVAVVQQRVGRHGDQLTGAIAQVNIIQRDSRNALLLGFVHDSLARGKNAFAVRIARRIGQVANHVLLDLFRRVKAKDRQVAQVQLDDLLALVLHFFRRIHDRAANVVKHVGQFGGFLNGFHRRSEGVC